jgi:hypothetical protein
VVLYYRSQTFTNTKASSLNQPRATHRIAALSSHACGFVLQLANFLQIQKPQYSTNREQRIVVFSSQACGQLANFYKYKSLITQPTESNASHDSHRRVVISCVWFCITACKLFTNTKASSLNQPIASHRSVVISSVVISCVWFCITACKLLQIQTYSSLDQPRSTQRIASPRFHLMRVVLYYSLQTFTNTKASSLNQPRTTQRIASQRCHLMCGFVLHIANLLQIQKPHHSTNQE